MARNKLLSPQPSARALEFIWPVRVYYEDTDAAGVVYHSNYLKYMERARTEWLRALGLSHERLREQEGILFVVTKMDIRFMKAAYLDEAIEARAKLIGVGGASLRFEQSINNASEETLCRAEVDVACLQAVTFKPQRIPDSIMVELQHDN